MRSQTLATFAIAAMSVGLSQSVSAADLPVRRAAPAPVVVAPIYSWTGIYAGVHAGYIWGDVDATTNSVGLAAALTPLNYSIKADGGMVGGQFGFNYQVNNFVAGIEADLSWTGLRGSATIAPLTLGGLVVPGSSHTSSFDMNWFGTVRGRLGIANNNWLGYVTGGFAFGGIDAATVTTSTVPGIGVVTWTGTRDETQTGWTIGGGMEWGFAPKWSLKGEYLYYDLGDTTVTATAPGLIPTIATTFDNNGHIARLGVNYRF